MKFFDTHSHYNDEAFSEDREEVFKKIKDANIEKIVIVCCSDDEFDLTVDIMNKHKEMYFAFGIHPENEMPEGYLEKLENLINNHRDQIVAVGEIGLDYHYTKDEKERQKEMFKEQIRFANKMKLPIIIHSRDAGEDTAKVLEEVKPEYGLVFHCYQPNGATLNSILKNGYYASFTGNITFKRNDFFYDVIKQIPLDRIMVETDCPYMAPEPHRGTRNDSSNIPIMAQKLADIFGKDLEEMSDILYENSLRFFNIKK